MNNEVVDKIATFLQSIGLELIMRPIEEPTFVPGILLECGNLVIDPEKLTYPGDMLHEAGHIATASAQMRNAMNGTLTNSEQAQGDEIAAQTWSYAACVYLDLDPKIVFHEAGYRNSSKNLIEAFAHGAIGVPYLQWMGLCCDKKNAEILNLPAYPHMINWLRQN